MMPVSSMTAPILIGDLFALELVLVPLEPPAEVLVAPALVLLLAEVALAEPPEPDPLLLLDDPHAVRTTATTAAINVALNLFIAPLILASYTHLHLHPGGVSTNVASLDAADTQVKARLCLLS
jgi:hypothetical protein